MPHWLDKAITLLQAETADLRELARIAGGDPRTFYHGINLADLDLDGQNIDGMEFSSALPSHGIAGLQLDLDLYAPDDERHSQHKALGIKSARRQEERTALLLAEFMRNRSRAMQVIEKYASDKADLTNSALKVLRNVRAQEIHGKHFSDLQIARKVSGCFAKAEDKRAVLAYYFAKHLPLYPEIRNWLQTKSIAKLSGEQQEEFQKLLELSHYVEALGVPRPTRSRRQRGKMST